ncbi:hypothetical protein HRbin26_00803 [bacterium HR26]|nr:hypothetical protein HRbin26_00803 [bacterium HR26]
MQSAELELNLAALGDAYGVLQGLRHVLEDAPHLFGALEVELIRLHPHALRIMDRGIGLDADQKVLHRSIGLVEVVDIVGRDQRQAEFPRQADELPVRLLLLGQAVILQLDEEALGAENVSERHREAPCLLLVAVHEVGRDWSLQTG